MFNWIKTILSSLGIYTDTNVVLERLEAPDYYDNRLSESTRITLFKSWTVDMQYMICSLLRGGTADNLEMAHAIFKHLKLMTERAEEHISLEPNEINAWLENGFAKGWDL